MKTILQQPFFKSFVLKLFLFLALLFVLDRVAGLILRKFYFKQQGGYDYLTTEAINKTQADLIVFGSSRAVNIFNTQILEQRSGLSSYNAGRYGEPIFYHYAVLKAVLKRHHPKSIILSFDAGNFSIKEDSYDRLAALLPYYNDHPELRKVVEMKSPFEKIKLLSASYPYNSLLLPIATGNTAGSKIKYANDNGYIPLDRTISGTLDEVDYTIEKDLDSMKIDIFTKFINECQAANIPLTIVCPPYLINQKGIDKSIEKGKEIAANFGVKFLDFSTDTFYTNKPHLFADYRHLNKTGVEYFVNRLMDSVTAKVSF